MKVFYAMQISELVQVIQLQLLIQCFKKHDIEVDIALTSTSKMLSEQVLSSFVESVSLKSHCVVIQESHARSSWQVFRLYRKLFKLSAYDLVVYDNDCVASWVAKTLAVPALALSHQVALNIKQQSRLHSCVNKCFQWLLPADYKLGVHWLPLAKNVIPPWVPSYDGESIDNKVVVFLPDDELTAIAELLKTFPDIEFYCFHPDATHITEGNIHFRPLQFEALVNDMLTAGGLISSVQFDLINIALSQGMRILLKPEGDDTSQALDADIIEEQGRAKIMYFLNPDALDDFLEQTPAQPIAFSSDPCELVYWIKAKKWQQVESLHHRLWQSVSKSC